MHCILEISQTYGMKDSSNTFLLLLLPLGLVTAAGHSMQLASPTYQEAVAMEIVNVGMELSEYYVLLKGETHIESFIRQVRGWKSTSINYFLFLGIPCSCPATPASTAVSQCLQLYSPYKLLTNHHPPG